MPMITVGYRADMADRLALARLYLAFTTCTPGSDLWATLLVRLVRVDGARMKLGIPSIWSDQ